MSDDWIKLKDAAPMLRTNEKRLRAKNADGSWKHFRGLSRIRPDGSKFIFFFKSEILALIEMVELRAKDEAQKAAAPIASTEPLINGIPAEALRQFSGSPKFLRRLGLSA